MIILMITNSDSSAFDNTASHDIYYVGIVNDNNEIIWNYNTACNVFIASKI